MKATRNATLTAVPVQVTIFAIAAVLLFLMAWFYPISASAAESQTLAAAQPIESGGSAWVAFDYSGGNEPIEIWIDSANDGVTFAVWTTAQLAADDSDPIGRGSDSDYTAGDAYWTGEFTDAGSYYIEVQNPGGAADTFSLYLQSDGVTAKSTLEPVAMEESEVIEGEGGGGLITASENLVTVSESATPTLEQWQAIAPGETVWFTVAYAGDDAAVEVWAESDSSDIAFAVYTNDQFANDSDPVGRGSDSDFTPGDLFWTGNFPLPDTLHIAVTNNGTTPGNYNLHITQ